MIHSGRAQAPAEPTLLSTMSPRNPASRMLEPADYLYLHRQCRGFWLPYGNKK
jgi:hypothetical protein